jgi:hypothetical protein
VLDAIDAPAESGEASIVAKFSLLALRRKCWRLPASLAILEGRCG